MLSYLVYCWGQMLVHLCLSVLLSLMSHVVCIGTIIFELINDDDDDVLEYSREYSHTSYTFRNYIHSPSFSSLIILRLSSFVFVVDFERQMFRVKQLARKPSLT